MYGTIQSCHWKQTNRLGTNQFVSNFEAFRECSGDKEDGTLNRSHFQQHYNPLFRAVLPRLAGHLQPWFTVRKDPVLLLHFSASSTGSAGLAIIFGTVWGREENIRQCSGVRALGGPIFLAHSFFPLYSTFVLPYPNSQPHSTCSEDIARLPQHSCHWGDH